MPTNKLTKIVATIGPATETEEILKNMILSGMNVARFNTKHGTPEWHHQRILRVKKVAQELDIPVGVMLDLQGPEIRIDLPEDQQDHGLEVEEGTSVYLTCSYDQKKENLVYIPEAVVEASEPELLILIDDGLCQLEIVKKSKDTIEAVALDSFVIKHRKTMTILGVVTNMPVLVENDYVQLDGIQENEVDYVALSFVRNKSDILTLRRELEKRDLTAGIVAKIENQAGLDNLDEIIEVSDAIMIARGDLGIEVPYEQLVYWQRKIIRKCRTQAKPVITATHMLETMIESPLPTRAEISDVAHAIYDGTSAVMLSGETAIGKFPLKALKAQAKIAEYNENYVEVDEAVCMNGADDINLAYTATNFLHKQSVLIDAVLCLSATGVTAAYISRNRPKVPVHVITAEERVYNQLTLYFGVHPHLVDWDEKDKVINADDFIQKIGPVKWLNSGDRLLVLHGPHIKAEGQTNTLSIATV